MLKDGLWDVYNDFAMGSAAEICAEKHGVSREDQVALHTAPEICFSQATKFCYLQLPSVSVKVSIN